MNFQNRTLFENDNLPILRALDADTVDLIYLDPPFNSNQDYAAPIGSEAAGAAFRDTWTLSDVNEAEHGELADREPALYAAIHAAGLTHGKSMKSYLIMMGLRMLEMRRALKETGSIYLHCDPTASHYLKLLMDAVFGRDNFRNEVVWKRTSAHNDPGRFGRIHDILLYYVKGEGATWNAQYEAHDPEYVKKYYRNKDVRGRYSASDLTASGTRQGESGQSWRNIDPTTAGNHWRPPRTGAYAEYIEKRFIPNYRQITSVHDRLDILNEADLIYWPNNGTMPRLKRYLDASQGRALQDIIVEVKGPGTKERTGYPTQKPLALLERIIKASSNSGDIVLDPFCGCATTCIAAEKLGRQWVGIDISPRAVELVRYRLERELGLDEREGLLGTVIHRTDIPRPSERLPNYRTHKHTLYGQQEGLCNGCRTHFPFRNMTVDHIVAQSQGGSDHLENLQLLCNFCNSVKGTNSQAYLITRIQEMGI